MKLTEVADYKLPIAFTMVQRLLDADKQVTLVLRKPDGLTRMGWLVDAEEKDDNFVIWFRTNMSVPVNFTRRQVEQASIKTLDGLKGGTGEPELSFVIPVVTALED